MLQAGAAPGDLDTTFTPNSVGESDSAIVQPDGKVVVVGDFSGMGGSTRSHIARLSGGTLDTGFNPGANSFVRNVGVQPDGKLIFTGLFTTLGGVARTRIARTDANGVVDASFNPNCASSPHCMAMQADGKVLLGGSFTTMGSVTVTRMARLHPDGALDTTFNAPADATVRAIRLLEDTKMLVAGDFTTISGESKVRVARLFSNGTVDAGFNASVDGTVYTLALQADGKIVIGGSFMSAGGQTRTRLARLMPDGALDTSFNVTLDDPVRSILIQTDGKIFIAGEFHFVNGAARSRVARLLPTGELDPGFSATAVSGGLIHGATMQADGRIIVAGLFATVGGVSRPALARLQNDEATQSLRVINPGRIEWLRGGSSPETNEVTFEFSTNGGAAWTPLSAAGRVPGGWVLNSAGLPAAGMVRARARLMCGLGTGSFGLVESVASYSFSALQMWRQANFETMESNGDSGDNADPDKDGLENLVEYALSLDPNLPDAAALPVWQRDDDNYLLLFPRPGNDSGVTCVAEFSESMAPDSWLTAADEGNEDTHIFVVTTAAPRLYLRMRVTAP